MDYKELLQAIDNENTVGSYLKAERSAYRSLRNAFNAAQSSFRRLTETPESSTDDALFEENQQNWLTVNKICWQTLTETSKDVEIYCWWVMSLAFQDQAINKISSALTTLVDFVDKFWPDVHPYLPDDKLSSENIDEQKKQRAELQLRPLVQLLGESANSGLLFMPLQMMTLIADIDHTQYFSATKSNKLASLKNQAQKSFPSAQAETTSIIQALALAIKSLEQLDVWLKNTIAPLAIPVISTTFLKANLNDNLQAIKYLVADCYTSWPLDAQQGSPENKVLKAVNQTENTDNNQQIQSQVIAETNSVLSANTHPLGSSTGALTAPLANGQLTNRDQAFQELRKIANYFAHQEPHSPISFLLEKAIRWGYMSLPELMLELVEGNDKVLNQINLVAGLNDEKTEIVASKQATEVIAENTTSTNNVNKLENTTQVSSEQNVPTGTEQKNSDNEFSW